MRQIEFRIWDIENQCFVDDRDYMEWGHVGGFNNFFKEKEVVFQQYTGFKDKNGNKIFDGDIVRGGTADTYFNKLFVEYLEGTGAWAFVYYIGEKVRFNNFWPSLKDIKIIGNVFQSPEPLSLKE